MIQLVLGETNIAFLVAKTKDTIQTFISNKCKSK